MKLFDLLFPDKEVWYFVLRARLYIVNVCSFIINWVQSILLLQITNRFISLSLFSSNFFFLFFFVFNISSFYLLFPHYFHLFSRFLLLKLSFISSCYSYTLFFCLLLLLLLLLLLFLLLFSFLSFIPLIFPLSFSFFDIFSFKFCEVLWPVFDLWYLTCNNNNKKKILVHAVVRLIVFLFRLQPLPVPDISNSDSVHSLAMACIWVHLAKKVKS